MQPFSVVQTQGQQVVDPLAPEVLELLRRRPPFWLRVDLVWRAADLPGTLIRPVLKERTFNTVIVGQRSDFNSASVRYQIGSSTLFFSNDFIPLEACSGGVGQNRQTYRWPSPIVLPGNVQLEIEARLGNDQESGAPKLAGYILFEAISLNP